MPDSIYPYRVYAASYIIARYRSFVNAIRWQSQKLGDEMAGFFKSLFGKREETVEALRPVVQETAAGAAGTSDAEPVHVTDELFEEVVLKSRVPTMVDFWAPWCGPCRMIAPIVEDLAQEYEGRAVIAKINTDENFRVADNLGIMGIPTLILFKDGKEVDRVVGFAPRKVLEQKLLAVLN